MRNYIYKVMLLIFLGMSTTKIHAQYTAYKLVLKSSGLYLTNNDGTLTMDGLRTGANALSQLFTIKKTTDYKVWVVSASNNTMYVKRSGIEVVLDSLSSSSNLDFHWQLNYAGDRYIALVKGDDTEQSLSYTNLSFGCAPPPTLTSLTDTSADNFRFDLMQVTNTF